MPSPLLRVFSDDHRHASASSSPFPLCHPQTVPVSMRDVLPLLLHAACNNRAWLEDFADDTLEISQDLYEILLAYKPIAEAQRRAA